MIKNLKFQRILEKQKLINEENEFLSKELQIVSIEKELIKIEVYFTLFFLLTVNYKK